MINFPVRTVQPRRQSLPAVAGSAKETPAPSHNGMEMGRVLEALIAARQRESMETNGLSSLSGLDQLQPMTESQGGGLFAGGSGPAPGSFRGAQTMPAGGGGMGMTSGGYFGGGHGGAAGAGAAGFAVGTGLDALARKMGASGTSLQAGGTGAGIGAQYGGPWGGLIGAGVGSGGQQLVASAKDPGKTKLFGTVFSDQPHPLMSHTPFPAEWIPSWLNPEIGSFF